MLTGTVLYLLSVTVLLSTLELLRYHEPHTFSCALLFWLTTSISLFFARLSLASVVSHVRRALSRGFGPFFFALPILVSTRSSHRRQPYPALSKKGGKQDLGRSISHRNDTYPFTPDKSTSSQMFEEVALACLPIVSQRHCFVKRSFWLLLTGPASVAGSLHCLRDDEGHYARDLISCQGVFQRISGKFLYSNAFVMDRPGSRLVFQWS